MSTLLTKADISAQKIIRQFSPNDVIALVDHREQKPFDMRPLRCRGATLATGDYSVKGLESFIAIERKSLQDLINCVGGERERFERELQRLLSYPTRAVVVEASWADLEAGKWRGQVKPESALGSVLGWIAQGVPIVMAGSREAAERYCVRMLFIAARRRWYELLSFGTGVLTERAQPAPADGVPPAIGEGGAA